MSTFNVKAIIKSARSLVEEAKVVLDDLELGHAVKRLHGCLHRAKQSLNKQCLGSLPDSLSS